MRAATAVGILTEPAPGTKPGPVHDRRALGRSEEQLGTHQREDRGEHPPEDGDGQAVGEPGPERRGQHTRGGDAGQAGQYRKPVLPAAVRARASPRDEADRTGDGDRKPQAAEVATARRMSTLHQIRNGTVSDPPPMPTRPDRLPIPVPTAARPAGPGRPRCAAGRSPRSSCAATISANAPTTRCSQAVARRSAMAAPSHARRRCPGEAADHRPEHRAAAVVRPDRRERRRDDGPERRAHREVRDHGLVEPVGPEHPQQRGHDHQPATDAEQAGERPGDATEHQIDQQVGHECSTRRCATGG